MTKSHLAILPALLLAAGISLADDRVPAPDDRMPAPNDTLPGVVHLPEVIVEASRTEGLIQDSPREIHVIQAKEIDGSLRATSPDALNELPSVLVQKTNLGGGAPILRGLSGNRVLLLVDGIRLNNSTYRAGPNQYFNTVDPGMAATIQVIPGPGSALFGSDAMGGVINVVGQEPAGSQPNILYNGMASTADGSQSHAASICRYSESAGILVGGTIRDFNDLRSGSGVVQVPTAYSEWSAFGRFLWQPADEHKFTLSYQANRQEDVPRTDRVVSGRDSVNRYNPQDRDLAFVRYETGAIPAIARSVLFTLSWNRQQEGREVISAGNTSVQVNQFDDVQTLGAMLEARAIAGKRTSLVYGGELYRDDVDSRGSLRNLVTGEEIPTVGSLPDDG
ncbi:MAG: iron complex outermembrane recepter protein [bacterium]|nr:MAG: iron complex outermembrane recepter protein [bacterium]